MENGRVEQIFEKLIDSVENGQSVPLAPGKVMVNKDETALLLRELASLVQTELRVYREVTDRKGKIITEAKKEAEDIIYEAEQTASRIRVTKRMSGISSGFRAESLDPEDKQALRTASDIYAASLIYTDEMLTEVNDVVAQAYDLVANQYGRMLQTLEEKANIIAQNKAELMSSLKELSKEERYSQILELGQLLSYELYNERMKAQQMETYGSYQMEMMFEEQMKEQTAKQTVAPVVPTETATPVESTASAVAESVTTPAEPTVQPVSAEPTVQPASAEPTESVEQSTPTEATASVTAEAAMTIAPIEPSSPKPSLEAVTKTLSMFKNYKPGVKEENSKDIKNDNQGDTIEKI